MEENSQNFVNFKQKYTINGDFEKCETMPDNEKFIFYSIYIGKKYSEKIDKFNIHIKTTYFFKLLLTHMNNNKINVQNNVIIWYIKDLYNNKKDDNLLKLLNIITSKKKTFDEYKNSLNDVDIDIIFFLVFKYING